MDENKTTFISKKIVFLIVLICLIGLVLKYSTVLVISYMFRYEKESYENMYKVSLPNESPAYGGTLYIPNNMEFIEKDNWNYIIEKENNEIIAIEVYHGYEKTYNHASYDWGEYELNPYVLDNNYDYDIFNYDIIERNAHCLLLYNNHNYAIYFYNTCDLKEFRNREYSRMYIFREKIDEESLKKMINSYCWAGII